MHEKAPAPRRAPFINLKEEAANVKSTEKIQGSLFVYHALFYPVSCISAGARHMDVLHQPDELEGNWDSGFLRV